MSFVSASVSVSKSCTGPGNDCEAGNLITITGSSAAVGGQGTPDHVLSVSGGGASYNSGPGNNNNEFQFTPTALGSVSASAVHQNASGGSDSISFSVVDTTSPSRNLLETLSLQSVYTPSGQSTIYYEYSDNFEIASVVATATNGGGTYATDTDSFSVDEVTSTSVLGLQAGTSTIEITASDTEGNTNVFSFNHFVQKASSELSLSLNGGVPLIGQSLTGFGSMVTPSTGDFTLKIRKNGVDVVSSSHTDEVDIVYVPTESVLHTVQLVSYSGDSNYFPANSNILTFTPAPTAGEVSIAASATETTTTEPVTITATMVTPGTGDISIKRDGTVVAQGPSPLVLTQYLLAGDYTYTATYDGEEGQYSGATDFINVESRVEPVLTLTANGVGGPTSVNANDNIAISASIAPSAAGEFDVFIDGALSGTSTGGSYSTSTSFASIGNHTISAVFAGDSTYKAVTKSIPVTVTDIQVTEETNDINETYNPSNPPAVVEINATTDSTLTSNPTLVEVKDDGSTTTYPSVFNPGTGRYASTFTPTPTTTGFYWSITSSATDAVGASSAHQSDFTVLSMTGLTSEYTFTLNGLTDETQFQNIDSDNVLNIDLSVSAGPDALIQVTAPDETINFYSAASLHDHDLTISELGTYTIDVSFAEDEEYETTTETRKVVLTSSNLLNHMLEVQGEDAGNRTTGFNASKLVGTKDVNFTVDGSELLRVFNFNLDNTETDFDRVQILSDNSKEIVIKNLDLGGATKEIVLPFDAENICVKDAEVASVSSITKTCSADDELLFTKQNCLDARTQQLVSSGNFVECRVESGSIVVSGLEFSAVQSLEAKLNSTHYVTTFGANENGSAFAGDEIFFVTNYTNITDDTPLTGGTCNVTYQSTTYNMPYNSTEQLYIANVTASGSGTQSYDISCSTPTVSILTTNDVIVVAAVDEIPFWTDLGMLVAILGTIFISGYVRRKEIN